MATARTIESKRQLFLINILFFSETNRMQSALFLIYMCVYIHNSIPQYTTPPPHLVPLYSCTAKGFISLQPQYFNDSTFLYKQRLIFSIDLRKSTCEL